MYKMLLKSQPHTREYKDLRFPLYCVHLLMILRGWGSMPLPTPFHSIYPLHSIYVKLRHPLHPLPSKTSEICPPVLKSIAPLPFSLVSPPILHKIPEQLRTVYSTITWFTFTIVENVHCWMMFVLISKKTVSNVYIKRGLFHNSLGLLQEVAVFWRNFPS